jgi:hypothetical protein
MSIAVNVWDTSIVFVRKRLFLFFLPRGCDVIIFSSVFELLIALTRHPNKAIPPFGLLRPGPFVYFTGPPLRLYTFVMIPYMNAQMAAWYFIHYETPNLQCTLPPPTPPSALR